MSAYYDGPPSFFPAPAAAAVPAPAQEPAQVPQTTVMQVSAGNRIMIQKLKQ